MNSLAGTGWAAIYRDGAQHEVFLVHQQTQAPSATHHGSHSALAMAFPTLPTC